MKLKILYINCFDGLTGAGIGGYRTFKGISDFCSDIDIEMMVRHKYSNDPKVFKAKLVKWWPIIYLNGKSQSLLQKTPINLFKSNNKSGHSRCNLNFISHKFINKSNYDIINLHWLGNEMFSIEEIGKINKPIVWKLADQWAFSGAEHYSCYLDPNGKTNFCYRYKNGYLKSNRPPGESGIDINKLTWQRKFKSWKKQIHIICPSLWLASCARKSLLMKNWPIHVIPNSIDTNIWYPQEKIYARKKLGLSIDKSILFMNGTLGLQDLRKGGDLLLKTLKILRENHSNDNFHEIELIALGQNKYKKFSDLKIPIHFFSFTKNTNLIRLLYAASDIVVIPSRQDNLPCVAQEAFACSRPIVAFDYSGLSNIVDHKINGLLAKAFDPISLSNSIRWLLKDKERLINQGKEGLYKARSQWDPEVISRRYRDVYHEIKYNQKII